LSRQILFNFPLAHGLHARPASLIQEIARRFTASITWENDRSHNRADCKSTLSLIASDTWKDDPCRIVIGGVDELDAEAALRNFLENEFPGLNETSPELQIPSGQEQRIPRVIKKEKALYFAGTGTGWGIARAPAFIFDSFHLEPPGEADEKKTNEEEICALQEAINKLALELSEAADQAWNPVEKDILTAHLAIVQDKAYLEKIDEYIVTRNFSAARAVFETAQYFAEILQTRKSQYIRQRLADIKDISARVILLLTCESRGSKPSASGTTGSGPRLTEPVILAAESILPSQFIALDKTLLKGLVISEAGTTSHSVILARAFNIPTVTGVENIHKKVNPAEELVVDAGRGLVLPAPNTTLSRFYDLEMIKLGQKRDKAAPFVSEPGTTADGKKLEVAANIGSVEELESAFQNGAEGVGLFRSEWLFMNRDAAPTEEEQFDIYSRAAAISGNRPIIIRTLDIGGDKPIPFLDLPKESNPFLGYRAIRIYNDFNELIDTQLRAILRASVFGNLKIMFPMVSCLEEVFALKKRLKDVMLELEKDGIPFNPGIQVGVMVEIPSVVFVLEEIAQEVDFFSVGSNDLSQYFFAADRDNPAVGYLQNPFYPAFLRLLKKIVAGVHAQDKWVGLCGEIAGDSDCLPLWVGLGFDEISLSSSGIPAVKAELRTLKFEECKHLVSQLSRKVTALQVEERLNEFFRSPTGVDLITEELIDLEAGSLTRDEAVREAVNLLDVAGRIENSDEVEELVWQREEAYSTGIGFGVATPHCHSPAIKNNSIAFLKLKTPIDWQSLDNQPVDMVFLLAMRASDRDKQHLKILARLSRKLMDEEFIAQLHGVEKPADVIALLKECTGNL
jgi:fructose-specific PTS system IIA-like component